ncbi:MAG TPA: PAS domain S-box protein [Terriglobales bacterium]|nr:PAS domain S-box protein [Terriglobales bacterium]
MSSHTSPAPGLVDGTCQLQTLLDSTQDLLALLDARGKIQYASPSFGRVLGFEPEELAGRSLSMLHHPSEVGLLQRSFGKIARRSGDSWTGRCSLGTKSGTRRWFDVSITNHLSTLGVNGLVAAYRDVTDLRRMESERHVISDIVHALNQTSNLDQLLQEIHEALTKVVYSENCFVALYDRSAEVFRFPFFVDQFDPPPAPLKLSRSCMAYVFRTGRARLIPQDEFDRLAAEGEVELVGSPSPAWLGVPLKTPTETIGVLVVQHYQNKNAYDQRDLEFLDSVGGHIALAIDRRQREEDLRKSESMFRLLFSQTPLPTWVIDPETLKFLQVNDAAVRQYGHSHEDFLRMSLADIQPGEDSKSFEKRMGEWAVTDRHQGHWRHKSKDGRVFEVDVISHRLDYAGRSVRLVVAQDVSDRQLLEEQLRQATKMEAVGRLAGGVAHDFNNLLMVVKGHTELLLDTLPLGDHVTRKIEQIDRSADRAATLTRQLLAFSRMQVLQPRVIKLNSVVEEMGRLIPRLIGEDIELVVRCAPDLGMIRADASQMEQIIMNLAVNARDAMPNGGRLMIETSNADLDAAYGASHPVVEPGRYALLAVTDTGIGMDAKTQTHIFEPFFTTKEKGKGTGLGLATVYGVVKQSGGYIWVYSELGKGTSFKIYLPLVNEPADKIAPALTSSQLPRGTETVLLAEDEQDVREVAREFLESAGYTVLEAHDGAEALRVAAAHSLAIDVLVTDMVMPGMSGQELARHLRQQRAGLQVIYMSGYSEQAAGESAKADKASLILTKPFSRGAILRAIRESLRNHRTS